MLFSPVFLALLSLAVSVQASPYVLHEKRSHLPGGWTVSRRHDATEHLPLRFGLRQSNMDQLDALLMDIADPQSPNYGAHWAPEKVATTFAPSKASVDAVRTWLLAEGVPAANMKIAPGKGWIQANVTVAHAERLLRTTYNVYTHAGGEQHVGMSLFSRRASVLWWVALTRVVGAVQAVRSTISRSTSRRTSTSSPPLSTSTLCSASAAERWCQPRRSGSPAWASRRKPRARSTRCSPSCSTATRRSRPCVCGRFMGSSTSPCQQARTRSASVRGSLMFPTFRGAYFVVCTVEYTPQAYVQSDLDMFNKNFSTAIVGKSPNLVSIDGGTAFVLVRGLRTLMRKIGVIQNVQTGFDFNGESNLDLQYAMNLVNFAGYKQNVTLYQVGDIPQGRFFVHRHLVRLFNGLGE